MKNSIGLFISLNSLGLVMTGNILFIMIITFVTIIIWRPPFTKPRDYVQFNKYSKRLKRAKYDNNTNRANKVDKNDRTRTLEGKR